ncbi:hypothetical protein [Aquabacterium sp.]|uniref:hypothetical protein n=1 Tax=Aquabacterium sp. TaxID=1872578 RepID=UPI0026281E8F|nr:hypothetical protein [Aquabacterium sp.]MDD2978129.1 hypothetical protein [Aquabacterium sp.]
MTTRSKLTTEIKSGETLVIGDVRITLERKSGQAARLVIDAQNGTEIHTPRSTRSDSLARRSAPPFSQEI